MNPMFMEPSMIEDIRAQNVNHYYNSSRLRAYCCGCIYSKSNTTYVCFFWAAISFYFAISAFLQRSPFYSYIDTVPLVAFGAINLLFGIVTLTSMILYTSWTHNLRMARASGIFTMNDSRGTVFAITANALAVLIVTLVNFILFIINKDKFDAWCIDESVKYVKDIYTSVNINSTIPDGRISDTQDHYNCNRLFEDEVKWSLLCLIIMFIVYIHWILIVAARKTYNFYYQRGEPGTLMSEYSNIAPKTKKSKTLNVFRNVKPSKSILRELLVHKQYGEFIPSEGASNKEKPNTNIPVTSSNVIHFEENVYNSKEIQPPCNAFYKRISDSSYSASDGASTVVNSNT